MNNNVKWFGLGFLCSLIICGLCYFVLFNNNISDEIIDNKGDTANTEVSNEIFKKLAGLYALGEYYSDDEAAISNGVYSYHELNLNEDGTFEYALVNYNGSGGAIKGNYYISNDKVILNGNYDNYSCKIDGNGSYMPSECMMYDYIMLKNNSIYDKSGEKLFVKSNSKNLISD